MCSNIFFINMKKNVGKRSLIEPIVTKLGAVIWDGIDKSLYDNNGKLISLCKMEDRTRAAKEAKIELLKYFLKNCNQNYLILFEDDIILHKKFYKYFNCLIQYANSYEQSKSNKFKLIYMGVSCYVHEQQNNCHFEIRELPQTRYRYSGAYGVVIHRSIINSIIRKSNDSFLYNRPFDIATLGHIQLSYPNECFICSPQLVIPNITISDIRNPRSQNIFWSLCHIDEAQYVFHKSIPLFVLSDDSELLIDKFISLLTIFVPYVHPVFICTNNNNIIASKYENAYEVIYLSDFSHNAIKDVLDTQTEYAITNIYVNWTKNIHNIFDGNTNIKYIIHDKSQILNNFLTKIDIFCGIIIIHNKATEVTITRNDNIFLNI